ncbi:MAG TPA: hypothetical protein VK638_02625 [Edaphobacter sp.]|nr:hypothetical protein [Edaphobacter sp.]
MTFARVIALTAVNHIGQVGSGRMAASNGRWVEVPEMRQLSPPLPKVSPEAGSIGSDEHQSILDVSPLSTLHPRRGYNRGEH